MPTTNFTTPELRKMLLDFDKRYPPVSIHSTLTPIPKERARGRSFYTPKRTREYEAAVRLIAKSCMQGKDMMRVSCRVNIQFRMATPKSLTLIEWLAANTSNFYPTVGDVDNYTKALLDACNGVVYSDDSLIASIYVERVYVPVKEQEGATMRVTRCGYTKDELGYLEATARELVGNGNNVYLWGYKLGRKGRAGLSMLQEQTASDA